MTPRALAYLFFTLLLAGIFAGIIAYYSIGSGTTA